VRCKVTNNNNNNTNKNLKSVLCSQTAFFHFSLWWQKKGLVTLPKDLLVTKLPDFGEH